jgi:uncharacterized protein (TIGR03086 family)
MTMNLDLRPPADEIGRLISGITDEQLSDPTPCEATSVGELLDHLMRLTVAFREAASNRGVAPVVGTSSPPPRLSRDNLPDDWRTVLTGRLSDLTRAWCDPSAWDGMTRVGGIDMPGRRAGLVALDELVLHGWDLAKGTGQAFRCDQASAQAVYEFTATTPRSGPQREGLFGPVIEVPVNAPIFEQALGLSGRHPDWPVRRSATR